MRATGRSTDATGVGSEAPLTERGATVHHLII